jgi:hypothetical protein
MYGVSGVANMDEALPMARTCPHGGFAGIGPMVSPA